MQFITKMSEDEPGDTPQEQTGSKNTPTTTTAIRCTGSKDFEKRYDEKWKTYYIISSKVFNKDKLPKDENEKNVPSRKKITEDITKEILNTIDADFHKLP